MDDIAGGRGRKGDALLTPPPRGPGLPSSSSSSPTPSGSGLLPSPPSAAAAAAAVLALPASRDPAGASTDAGLLLAAPRLTGAMMEGGGEALLVRRSKGKKNRPAAAAAPADRDSGAVGRFRSLWRDYNDLLEETEAKKRRLASANRAKHALRAEVKFLRKKYECFVKGHSQKTHYKLKKKARYVPSPLGSNMASASAGGNVTWTEGPSTSKNQNIDLNQGSVMNEDGNDCHGHQENDKFDRVGVDEEMVAADAKLSVCRDTGNSPASDDKRTISWQDRLALQA